MRRPTAGLLALMLLLAPPALAVPRPPDIASTAAGIAWISAYRSRPAPAQVLAMMQALSRLGAFGNPENAGPILASSPAY